MNDDSEIGLVQLTKNEYYMVMDALREYEQFLLTKDEREGAARAYDLRMYMWQNRPEDEK